MSDSAIETPAPPGYDRGVPIPWQLKMWLKVGLGLSGIPPAFLRKLGLRRHSVQATDPHKLVDVVIAMMALATREAGRAPRTTLEIGPGRMVVRAPVWAALGLERTWLADIEDDSPQDVESYRHVAMLAAARGLAPPSLQGAATPAEILRRCNAELLLGADSLTKIPDGSVDFSHSAGTLEHVRRDALVPLLAMLRRTAAPGSVHLHAISFHDHMGGALNNLGFSPEFWEGRAIGSAGVYTNRLGLSEMRALFHAAGFTTETRDLVVWPAAPWPRAGMHPAVRRSEADARIAAGTILARPVE